MPYEEYPTPRRIQSGLPGADVLHQAGLPMSFWNRIQLGIARLFGGLEPVDKALPAEVMGVPTQGRERMGDWVEFLRPFVTRPNFGQNPQDAEDVLDAFTQKSLGGLGTEGERASNLLRVYRRALAKKNLEQLGLFEAPEEPAKGLVGIMQNRR
jgi:hypothetical protein